jgi:hypothetical protein
MSKRLLRHIPSSFEPDQEFQHTDLPSDQFRQFLEF